MTRFSKFSPTVYVSSTTHIGSETSGRRALLKKKAHKRGVVLACGDKQRSRSALHITHRSTYKMRGDTIETVTVTVAYYIRYRLM
jgi:hypothetical protein